MIPFVVFCNGVLVGEKVFKGVCSAACAAVGKMMQAITTTTVYKEFYPCEQKSGEYSIVNVVDWDESVSD